VSEKSLGYNPQIGDLVLYSSKGYNTLGIIKEIRQYTDYDPDAIDGTLYRVLWLTNQNVETGYPVERIMEYRQDYLSWRKDNGL
jgi:hypothetical protein